MAEPVRQEKLRKLRDLKINPYPYLFNQSHKADFITSNFDSMKGKKVNVAGRIIRMRGMGKLFFIDLLDSTGKIQIFARTIVTSKKAMQTLELTDRGDIIGVEGRVIKSERGEISVEAKEITMLAKSLRTMPEKFHGLSDVELRYRKRYLDLISNPEVRKIFRTRAAVIAYIRNFLDGRGYIEVETPILQETYGGANAKPFITYHNALGVKFFLRIADELYLKRLIVGGIDRVYEFGKDFRNEDIDSTHNPEFTMLEAYEAYGDYNTYMEMVEELMSGLVKKLFGTYELEYQGKKISFKPPFKRLPFCEKIEKESGIDAAELTDEKAAKIATKMQLETKVKNAYHVADALFDKYVKSEISHPTFVIDYPSYMCPLAKDKRGNGKLSERFELFVAGGEFANAYSELTDPMVQREKFEAQVKERKLGDEEMPPSDENFLEAIEYGMPPTAGIGIGIDRLVTLLTDNVSLKEVILFPSVKPEKQAE